MAFEKKPPRIDQNFGRVRLLLDDLRQVESALNFDGTGLGISCEGGYTATSVDDLKSMPSRSLAWTTLEREKSLPSAFGYPLEGRVDLL